MSQEKDMSEQSMELQVQVPQDIQQGCYANQFIASHTPEEFILDFILATPPSGIVNARVLVSPMHAKRMVATLQENIHRYEQAFGVIEERKLSFTVPTNGQPH